MIQIRMNLKNVILDENSQSQKATHCMTPFIWDIQKSGKQTSGCLELEGGGIGSG